MAPFKYEPFVNPYVGSIIDLMGKGDEAKAQALLRVGEIEAQAARQRGQVWSGAIQGAGNIASSEIEKWNSPEARRQRELDEAEKIHAERSQEQQQHPALRVVEGHAIPEIVPPERVEPFSRPYRDNFGVDPSVSGGSNPLRGAFGAGQSVDARDPRANALEGAFGTVTEGRSPDDLQSYLKDPVSRYTTKNGLYDIQLAHADLLAAGVSPSIANTIAKQGLEANTIFEAADALDTKYQQSQIDVRGAIAHMAISLREISPDMTWDKAVEEVMGPAEYRENPEQFQQFMAQFHGESPEGKEAILRNMVSEWDRQGPQTVVKRGDKVLGQSGNTMFSSPLATTATMADRVDYEAYAASERLNGREPLSKNAWVAREKAAGTAAGKPLLAVGSPFEVMGEDGKAVLRQHLSNGTTMTLGVPIPETGSYTDAVLTDISGRQTGTVITNTKTGETYFQPVKDGQYTAELPAQIQIMSLQNEAALDVIARLESYIEGPDSDMGKMIGPFGGRSRSAFLALGDFGQSVGQFFGDTEQDQKDFAEFKAVTAGFKNAVIKAITGAQMSEQEAKRIMEQIPTENDILVSWKAKAKASVYSLNDLENRMRSGINTTGDQPVVHGVRFDDSPKGYTFIMGKRSDDTEAMLDQYMQPSSGDTAFVTPPTQDKGRRPGESNYDFLFRTGEVD